MKKWFFFLSVMGMGLWSFCGMAVDYEAKALDYCRAFAEELMKKNDSVLSNTEIIRIDIKKLKTLNTQVDGDDYRCFFQLSDIVFGINLKYFMGEASNLVEQQEARNSAKAAHTQSSVILPGGFLYTTPDDSWLSDNSTEYAVYIAITKVERFAAKEPFYHIN